MWAEHGNDPDVQQSVTAERVGSTLEVQVDAECVRMEWTGRGSFGFDSRANDAPLAVLAVLMRRMGWTVEPPG